MDFERWVNHTQKKTIFLIVSITRIASLTLLVLKKNDISALKQRWERTRQKLT
jgi:hypothetical protein